MSLYDDNIKKIKEKLQSEGINNVIEIPFERNTLLTKYDVKKYIENTYLDDCLTRNFIEAFIISNKYKKLGDSCFSEQSCLKKVIFVDDDGNEVLNDLMRIRDHTFSNTKIEEFYFSKNLSYIGELAFYNTPLKKFICINENNEIVFPMIKFIGDHAFSNTKIEEFYLSDIEPYPAYYYKQDFGLPKKVVIHFMWNKHPFLPGDEITGEEVKKIVVHKTSTSSRLREVDSSIEIEFADDIDIFKTSLATRFMIKDLVIGNNVKIIDYCSIGNKYLETLDIPKSVNEINTSFLFESINLKTIYIEYGLNLELYKIIIMALKRNNYKKILNTYNIVIYGKMSKNEIDLEQYKKLTPFLYSLTYVQRNNRIKKEVKEEKKEKNIKQDEYDDISDEIIEIINALPNEKREYYKTLYNKYIDEYNENCNMIDNDKLILVNDPYLYLMNELLTLKYELVGYQSIIKIKNIIKKYYKDNVVEDIDSLNEREKKLNEINKVLFNYRKYTNEDIYDVFLNRYNILFNTMDDYLDKYIPNKVKNITLTFDNEAVEDKINNLLDDFLEEHQKLLEKNNYLENIIKALSNKECNSDFYTDIITKLNKKINNDVINSKIKDSYIEIKNKYIELLDNCIMNNFNGINYDLKEILNMLLVDINKIDNVITPLLDEELYKEKVKVEIDIVIEIFNGSLIDNNTFYLKECVLEYINSRKDNRLYDDEIINKLLELKNSIDVKSLSEIMKDISDLCNFILEKSLVIGSSKFEIKRIITKNI